MCCASRLIAGLPEAEGDGVGAGPGGSELFQPGGEIDDRWEK